MSSLNTSFKVGVTTAAPLPDHTKLAFVYCSCPVTMPLLQSHRELMIPGSQELLGRRSWPTGSPSEPE